jgi:hypothetical protein
MIFTFGTAVIYERIQQAYMKLDKQERTCNDNGHYNQHFFSVSTHTSRLAIVALVTRYISTLKLKHNNENTG